MPTNLEVGQMIKYLNLLDLGWKIRQFEAVFCLQPETKSLSLDTQNILLNCVKKDIIKGLTKQTETNLTVSLNDLPKLTARGAYGRKG